MIVPRSRLLLWVALMVLPFSLLGAVEQVCRSFLIVSSRLLILVLSWMLWSAVEPGWNRTGTSPGGAHVEGPRGKIEMRIRKQLQATPLRLGLAFPREIHSAEEMDVLARGNEWSRITWTCQPFKRGNYHLASPPLSKAVSARFLGHSSRQVPTPSEIRVYPNLLTERKIWQPCF